MKKSCTILLLVVLAALSLLLVIAASATEARTPDSVLAIVNGEEITLKDVNVVTGSSKFYNDINGASTKSSPTTEKQALNILIDNAIIEQMFKDENISLSNDELAAIQEERATTYKLIEDAITNGSDSEKQNAGETLRILEESAKYTGLTVEEYKELIFESLVFAEKLRKLADKSFSGDTGAVRTFAQKNHDKYDISIK